MAIIGVIVLIIQLLLCFVMSVNAQSEVSFTSEDIFEIPSQSSSIRFATSGTYKSANLNDGVWSFQSLYMTDSRGIITTDLPEEYYWIEIDSNYYHFDEEVYLEDNGAVNIIEIESPSIPGFVVLLGILALGIVCLIYKKREESK